jgi:hypothetical protein
MSVRGGRLKVVREEEGNQEGEKFEMSDSQIGSRNGIEKIQNEYFAPSETGY